MDDTGAGYDDTAAGISLISPTRAERAISDPLREFEDIFVDEYGSNTTSDGSPPLPPGSPPVTPPLPTSPPPPTASSSPFPQSPSQPPSQQHLFPPLPTPPPLPFGPLLFSHQSLPSSSDGSPPLPPGSPPATPPLPTSPPPLTAASSPCPQSQSPPPSPRHFPPLRVEPPPPLPAGPLLFSHQSLPHQASFIPPRVPPPPPPAVPSIVPIAFQPPPLLQDGYWTITRGRPAFTLNLSLFVPVENFQTLQHIQPFFDDPRGNAAYGQWLMQVNGLNGGYLLDGWMAGGTSFRGPAYPHEGYYVPPGERPPIRAVTSQPTAPNFMPAVNGVPMMPFGPDVYWLSWRPA